MLRTTDFDWMAPDKFRQRSLRQAAFYAQLPKIGFRRAGCATGDCITFGAKLRPDPTPRLRP
jgi:hypothetical protein